MGRDLGAALRCWWTIRDLNTGPTGYEPAALTTALMVHMEGADYTRAISNHILAHFSVICYPDFEEKEKIEAYFVKFGFAK